MRCIAALLAASLAVPAVAAAQGVEVGLKGGVVFSQLPEYMDTLRDFGADDVQGRTGVVFGAHVAFPITSNFAVQPEALYTQRGIKAFLPSQGDFQLQADYLDVPVLLRFGPVSGGGFQLLAGPSFNFNTRAKLVFRDFDDDEEDIADDVEDLDVGIVLGAGYYGANFLVEGNAPLCVAAVKGHTEAVEVLLKRGADPNFQENNGWTALHYAVSKGHVPVVKALLRAGADPEIRESSSHGMTASYVAALRGHPHLVQLLDEHARRAKRRWWQFWKT